MSMYINIGGGQKQLTSLYANVNGTQKSLSYAYTNINGSGRKIFPPAYIYKWKKYALTTDGALRYDLVKTLFRNSPISNRMSVDRFNSGYLYTNLGTSYTYDSRTHIVTLNNYTRYNTNDIVPDSSLAGYYALPGDDNQLDYSNLDYSRTSVQYCELQELNYDTQNNYRWYLYVKYIYIPGNTTYYRWAYEYQEDVTSEYENAYSSCSTSTLWASYEY